MLFILISTGAGAPSSASGIIFLLQAGKGADVDHRKRVQRSCSRYFKVALEVNADDQTLFVWLPES